MSLLQTPFTEGQEMWLRCKTSGWNFDQRLFCYMPCSWTSRWNFQFGKDSLVFLEAIVKWNVNMPKYSIFIPEMFLLLSWKIKLLICSQNITTFILKYYDSIPNIWLIESDNIFFQILYLSPPNIVPNTLSLKFTCSASPYRQIWTDLLPSSRYPLLTV